MTTTTISATRKNGTKNPVGLRVEFTNRWGDKLRGVIVSETYFAHCPGACDVTVFAMDGTLYRLDQFSGSYQEMPTEDRTVALQEAREAYKASLVQYPIWAERFAAQGLAACGF